MQTLNPLISDGFDKLMVITDFDRTMTKAFVDGKVTALISIMVREKIFDDDYVEKMETLYKKYRPMEVDESLARAERARAMEIWWETTAQILIDKQLSKAKLTAAIAKAKYYLREGVAEFLQTLHQYNVPVLIFSGNGLGIESIKIFLELHDLDFPNIHLYGNQFVWNEQGVAVDYVKPLVHVFNKDFQLVKDSPLYEKIDHRQNVIAIGDNISDLDMIKNCEYQHLHKVGFLNEKAEQLRPNYQRAFDTVIENDGSFEYLNQLLAKIAPSHA